MKTGLFILSLQERFNSAREYRVQSTEYRLFSVRKEIQFISSDIINLNSVLCTLYSLLQLKASNKPCN